MSRTYIMHELKLLLRSRRNIPFVVLFGMLACLYSFYFLPKQETKENLQDEGVQLYLTNLENEQKARETKGYTGLNLMAGVVVYDLNDQYRRYFKGMLSAYESLNYQRYLTIRYAYLKWNPGEYINDQHLLHLSPFPGKDREHLYNQILSRYEDYIERDVPVTYGILFEKTGLQTLQKFFQSNGFFIIFICAVFFASNLLAKDRENRTLLQGWPLSWYQQINLKTVSAFIYTIFVTVFLLVFLFTTASFQFGTGPWSLQMPIIQSSEQFGVYDYTMQPIVTFLLQSLIVMGLLVWLFIRLTICLGLWVKNEWLVLILSGLVVFSDQFFDQRVTRGIVGIDRSLFPQTYFDFGKILTREKNFLLNMESIGVWKGVIILIVFWIFIELLLFFSTRVINKRRFYQR